MCIRDSSLTIEKGQGILAEFNHFDDSKYKGFNSIVKSIKTSQKEISFGEEITKDLSKSINENAEKLKQEINHWLSLKAYNEKTESGKSAFKKAQYAIKQLEKFKSSPS